MQTFKNIFGIIGFAILTLAAHEVQAIATHHNELDTAPLFNGGLHIRGECLVSTVTVTQTQVANWCTIPTTTSALLPPVPSYPGGGATSTSPSSGPGPVSPSSFVTSTPTASGYVTPYITTSATPSQSELSCTGSYTGSQSGSASVTSTAPSRTTSHPVPSSGSVGSKLDHLMTYAMIISVVASAAVIACA